MVPRVNFDVDWRRVASDYDGIEVMAGSDSELNFSFKGWDCDSICVFAKQVIVLV